MNNLNTYITRIILFVLISFSCEQVITLEIPDHEPRLVVNAILNPQLPNLIVGVTSSTSIMDTVDTNTYTGFAPVDNASIRLFENGTEISSFSFSSEFESYSSDPITYQPNAVYRIEVSAPGFEPVYATTRMPEVDAEIISVSVNSAVDNSGNTGKEIRMRLKENDSGDNRYGILQRGVSSFTVRDPQVIQTSNSNLVLFEDNAFQNGIGEISFNTYEFEFFNVDFIEAFVVEASDEYFEYQKSFYMQSESRLSEIFPGSPVEVYSNIVGGYGVFAAFDTKGFRYNVEGSVFNETGNQQMFWNYTGSENKEFALDFELDQNDRFTALPIDEEGNVIELYERVSRLQIIGSLGGYMELVMYNYTEEESSCFIEGRYDNIADETDRECVFGACDGFEMYFGDLGSRYDLSAINQEASNFLDLQICDGNTITGSFHVTLENGEQITGSFENLGFLNY